MSNNFTVLVGALLGLTSLGSQAQQLNTAKLDSLLNTLAVSNRMMGSLAISRSGQVVYSRAFGAAQLSPLIAATPSTRYRANYLDKVFTTVMIYQLIEEGKLTLATPLATFFPQFPRAADITIDHLMTERSGLQTVTYEPGQVMTQAELLVHIAKPRTQTEIYPGTPMGFPNYVLLEAIIARLTGQPYAKALQTRVLAKAGLQNTYYSRKIDPKNQEAQLIEMRGTGWLPIPDIDLRGPTGAGTLVTTPTDLARFSETLYGGRLVSAAHLKELLDGSSGLPRAIITSPFEQHPGYSYTVDIVNRITYSFVDYFPAEKLTVALCTNAQYYSFGEALKGIVSTCFGKPYAIPSFPPPVYRPSIAELDHYTGNYAGEIPLRYTVKREGNTLRLESAREGNSTLEPVSPGVFRHGTSTIEFAPDQPAFVLRQRYGSYIFIKQ